MCSMLKKVKQINTIRANWTTFFTTSALRLANMSREIVVALDQIKGKDIKWKQVNSEAVHMKCLEKLNMFPSICAWNIKEREISI